MDKLAADRRIVFLSSDIKPSKSNQIFISRVCYLCQQLRCLHICHQNPDCHFWYLPVNRYSQVTRWSSLIKVWSLHIGEHKRYVSTAHYSLTFLVIVEQLSTCGGNLTQPGVWGWESWSRCVDEEVFPCKLSTSTCLCSSECMYVHNCFFHGTMTTLTFLRIMPGAILVVAIAN